MVYFCICSPIVAATFTYEEVCDRVEVREHFMKDLCTIAKSHGLQGWEVPAGLLSEPVPFSLENGLLTAVQKKNRPKLELKYGSCLEELYTRISAKRYCKCSYLRVFSMNEHY